MHSNLENTINEKNMWVVTIGTLLVWRADWYQFLQKREPYLATATVTAFLTSTLVTNDRNVEQDPHFPVGCPCYISGCLLASDLSTTLLDTRCSAAAPCTELQDTTADRHIWRCSNTPQAYRAPVLSLPGNKAKGGRSSYRHCIPFAIDSLQYVQSIRHIRCLVNWEGPRGRKNYFSSEGPLLKFWLQSALF